MARSGIATRPTQDGDHRVAKSPRSAPATEKALATPTKTDWEQAVDLFCLAEDGDQEAFDRLKKHPKFDIFISIYGLTSKLEDRMAEKLFGKQCLVAKDGLNTEIQTLRDSLLTPTSSPLESLLATEIALAWVVLRQAQLAYADLTSGSPSSFQIRESRLDRALSRYLAAIRTFAQVRRLQIPTLFQVNVANQQLNLS